MFSLFTPKSKGLSYLVWGFCLIAVNPAMHASAQPEISKFNVFFEFNSTDLDVGLHGFLDADAWQSAEIIGPGGSFTVLEVDANAESNEFGINEFFFESNEPSLLERSFQELLMQFPAGDYEAEVLTVDNEMLSEEAELTEDIPCPPVVEEPDVKSKKNEVLISWTLTPGVFDPDTQVCDDNEDVNVIYVEAIIVLENEITDESREFNVALDPSVTEIEGPEEFIAGAADAGFDAKAEVIVTEESGNRTSVEIEFDLD